MHTFGARLRTQRVLHMETQEQLADKIHADPGTVSRWERNEVMPHIDQLVAVAKHYGVSLDYLVLGDGEPVEASAPKQLEVVLMFQLPSGGAQHNTNYAVVRGPNGLAIWESGALGTPLREVTEAELALLIQSTSLAYHSLQTALALVAQENAAEA